MGSSSSATDPRRPPRLHLPRPSSVTHEHLLAVLNSIHRRFEPDSPLRVLDVGCGNGTFLAYAHQCMTALAPERTIEWYGFDISDHGQRGGAYIETTRARLAERFPTTDWSIRIRLIDSSEDWPFQNDFFHLALSNQVLEHVQDPTHFFRQLNRVLEQGGVAVHLFPLINYVREGHLRLPFVHRIQDYELLVRYIWLLSALGFGRYPKARIRDGMSLREYATTRANYMTFATRYMTHKEVLHLGKSCGFRTSFRYTAKLYTRKLRHLLRRPVAYTYPDAGNAFLDALAIRLLRYVAPVTLVVEKARQLEDRQLRSMPEQCASFSPPAWNRSDAP